MKYSAAIGGPDEDAWKEEIKNEHERTKKYDVFKEVKRQEQSRSESRTRIMTVE